MKNKTNKLLGFLLALFAVFTITSAKAQSCGVTIKNGHRCDVKVTIKIYDFVIPGLCQSSPCNSYNTTVPAGAIIAINCAGCSAACDIVVTVTDCGVSPVPSPSSASFSAAGPQAISTPGCSDQITGAIQYIAGNSQFYIN